VERKDVHVLVDVVHVEAVPPQSAGVVLEVAAQPDEVAVEPDDPLEAIVHVPVERHVVPEPAALEELLPLEQHGDAR